MSGQEEQPVVGAAMQGKAAAPPSLVWSSKSEPPLCLLQSDVGVSPCIDVPCMLQRHPLLASSKMATGLFHANGVARMSSTCQFDLVMYVARFGVLMLMDGCTGLDGLSSSFERSVEWRTLE